MSKTPSAPPPGDLPKPRTLVERVIGFCITNKLVVSLLTIFFIFWGIIHAPFDWKIPFLHRAPVPVDAIPDIGENQQIVFAEWMGRSPQDMEDQVTYPLTVALLGVPEVKTIRSESAFGFSMIFVIFNEDAEFYWARSRILEKLNSLPPDTLPEGVQPMLGPDATALGQVFWYTLEGRDPQGKPTGGWDLSELRSIQDFTVRYALQSAEGVSEVASIGGYVKEYQVDVDPDAMRAHGVTLPEIVNAVRMSNLDVGASVFEVNQVEYTVRGIGFLKSVSDLENAVIKVADNVPIYVKNVAHVSLGPELRRGALDKEGAEVVGGVIVVRHGENPLEAIGNVKKKIAELAPSLPKKTLADGTTSQVTLVPFYDRSELIYETLGTLNDALYLEILVTTIVVLVMVRHFASSLLISGVMPLAVLGCFIAMRFFKVDANIVSLSGIAIAIGTVVDMGIIVCENILKHLDAMPADARGDRRRTLPVIYKATCEVGSAVVTAISTTIISFLPVFAMEGAEGKLFKPLAFTKTFALLASVIIALTILPAAAHAFFRHRKRAATSEAPKPNQSPLSWVAAVFIVGLISAHWMPLGPDRGLFRNFLLVALILGATLGALLYYQRIYERILRWCLNHKRAFLLIPTALVLLGLMVWLGFDRLLGWMPRALRTWGPISTVAHAFPGLGKEFMPPLDEGSYLYMPSTLPHASLDETLDVLQKQDMAFYAIPEVETAVGKLGRAESPLDPAPVQMIETVINYRSEYATDRNGHRLSFKYDATTNDLARSLDGAPVLAPDGKPYFIRGTFLRDAQGELIPDPRGKPFRQWRPPLDPELNPGREAWAGIRKPDDIWDEIVRAAEIPGTTAAPRLQPIATRVVMLQSGMRSPMGLKVHGPNLEVIEKAGIALEKALREVPMVEPSTVIADRIVGKPYLEVVPDRIALPRYGIRIEDFQDVLEVAIGGQRATRTIEGRERYPVRVRYARELRDSPEALRRILVPAMNGAQIPLEQLAEIRYARGPEMIRSEDTFLTGFVIFDKKPQFAEVDVVQQARQHLEQQLASGQLVLPPGVSYTFAGSYENQIRASQRLATVIPLTLFIIFMILYFQFRDTALSFFVFTGIFIAWSGGFLLIWLYAQDWFLNFHLFGVNMRDLFQVNTINLSVAIWVGFLALFGVATDDGVIMCTYLTQRFEGLTPRTAREIREATIEAGLRRVRPCMMTTATTILALIPVLTSSGRGADIMIPMAIPSFGGMTLQVMTTLVAPVLFCWREERRLAKSA